MRVRYFVVLAMSSAATVACAQEADTEVVQQVSTTQAHLRESNPVSGKSSSAAPVLARLLGKMLSEQFKDVRVDLTPEAAPASAAAPYQGALHLNRRAEICFENYRVGFKRDGMVMRYELTF